MWIWHIHLDQSVNISMRPHVLVFPASAALSLVVRPPTSQPCPSITHTFWVLCIERSDSPLFLKVNMTPDPYDSWYAKQLAADGGTTYRPENWDFFTISHDHSSTGAIEENEVAREDIDKWLNREVGSVCFFYWPWLHIENTTVSLKSARDRYSVRMRHLDNPREANHRRLSRHKNCSIRNIPKPCSPFAAAHFLGVLEALSLSPQHIYIRAAGGAHSCTFTCQTYKDEGGHITGTCISFPP